ncbi:Ger(x)C family spore germination protein [Paenibacillus mucilaginosus]|uniref:Germination protein, Ger(X)C family n=1 Tax=Paenibacillus mucilaginosus (strain KNP414) TaxID=1036673 RepID=F8FQ95_PAEMK|nr:Ger(x)C family spore germination protein [Paenibacillus mucilaginosus]AEI40315.1 germination protein, Ger(x)C family [Paenibacillus mucilaginosus KNP414]MCG7213325.1 Ger(x)C family spore germination protein [Paenibacillus mucilaginosus]WDM29522.1 Ger(x)C family spore germination protein [Paenibacillus mucilaginosus]
MKAGNLKRAFTLLWICLPGLVLLTGCWDRRELNEVSVALAAGIDMVDGGYEVTLQVVDPSQMSRNRSADRSPTLIVSEKDLTVYEAIRKITTKASRKMYAGHLQLLILDEKIAKQGIREALDLFFRDYEPRPSFNIVLSRGYSAKDILSIVTPFEVLPAADLYKSLQVSERAWAPTAAVNVVDLYQMLTKKGLEPVLTGITLIGDVDKGKKSDNVKQQTTYGEYQYKGIGVFRDDKLLGWLNESDSKAYSYVMNKVSSTVGKAKCPGGEGEFAVEVTEAKSSMKPMLVGGKPEMHIKLSVEGNIGEVTCAVDLKKEKDFLALEQAGRDTIHHIVDSGIRNSQQLYGVDIYGFGIAFHRKFPAQWHLWEKDWNSRFKEIHVLVEIDYHLRKLGKIISPLESLSKSE